MIKEISKYRDNIFKDLGLYIAIGICILYLAIFRPWAMKFDIINNRVWIGGVSLAIIALAATFCYQVKNFLQRLSDSENEFYNRLLANGILEEVQFLSRWSVYSGLVDIVSLVAYNILIYSRMFDNTTLGTLAVIPIFSTVYALSEFINNLRTEMGLSKFNLEYKKIHSEHNDKN